MKKRAVSIAQTFTVLVTTEPLQIIGSMVPRNYLMLQNNGAVTIFLGFGNKPNVDGTNSIQLLPNSVLTFDGNLCPNNEIYAVATAQNLIAIVEGRDPNLMPLGI